jgi:hypothetical protein
VAIVVLTNGDFAGAQETITSKIAQVVLPKSAQAQVDEAPRTRDAEATLKAIVAGKYDPAKFTPDAQFYFSAQTLADYRTSLGKLGSLTSVAPLRPPVLRGGFVNRNFRLHFGKTSLIAITYAEPGANGRWEQFIVTPE